MGFSRQEYWSGLPCPPPGDLPNPGIEPASIISPALAGGFLTISTTWEAQDLCRCDYLRIFRWTHPGGPYLNPMTSILKRVKGRRGWDTRRKAKVETGIMLPQAKECEEPWEARRGHWADMTAPGPWLWEPEDRCQGCQGPSNICSWTEVIRPISRYTQECVFWWVPGWTREFLVQDWERLEPNYRAISGFAVGHRLEGLPQAQIDISPRGSLEVRLASWERLELEHMPLQGPQPGLGLAGWIPGAWVGMTSAQSLGRWYCGRMMPGKSPCLLAVAESPGRQGYFQVCSWDWQVCHLGMGCLFKTPFLGHGLY